MRLFDIGALAVGEESAASHTVKLIAGFDDQQQANNALSIVRQIDADSVLVAVESSESDEWAKSRRAWVSSTDTAHWQIHPPWLSDEVLDGSDQLVIDPGSAFGDAGHPTTRLVLDMLPATVDSGASVVDVGTGTGILAIAAAKLGAQVVALEIDGHAARVAEANISANNQEAAIELRFVDASEWSYAGFDVALVNVTIDIHRTVSRRLRDVETVVAAGILENQVEELLQLYKPRSIVEIATERDWATIRLA